MSKKLNQTLQFITPFKGILLFMFLLLLFHFAWKIAIDGDMTSENIYLFGKDITPSWFETSCQALTKMATWFIQLFPNTQDLLIRDNGTALKFPTEGNTWIGIIWGCLGFKQMAIFGGVILFYWGPFLKKLWYIPLGWIILTAYNIIRIAIIVWRTDGHPEKFESLHDGILRLIYYGIVFLLWLVWAEFFDKNKFKYVFCSNKNSKSKKVNAN